MRISHTHKFVFLANPRTGSTTVRRVLDPFSDIASVHITKCTSAFPFYHHISAKELEHIFCEKGWDWDGYFKFCVVRNPYDRVVSLYHHHIKMMQGRDNGRGRLFNLKMRLKYSFSKPLSFNEYVRSLDSRGRLTEGLRDFTYSDQGQCLVDCVLKYEDLQNQLPSVLEGIGISVKASDIPHLNASSNRKDYVEYYDSETRAIVEERYAYEIQQFGYSLG